MASTPSKTVGTAVLAMQAVATAAAAAGKVEAEVDVASAMIAEIVCWVGRTATTAFSSGTGVDWFFQTSDVASGNGGWRTIAQFGTGTLAAANTNNMAASGNDAGVGDTSTFTLSANNAANYAASKSLLHVYQAGDVTKDEFFRAVLSSTGATALRVDHNSLNAHNSDVVYDGNWMMAPQLDVSSANRLRVLCINNSGVTVVVKAVANLFEGLA